MGMALIVVVAIVVGCRHENGGDSGSGGMVQWW
jgi:hypothetical protein